MEQLFTEIFVLQMSCRTPPPPKVWSLRRGA